MYTTVEIWPLLEDVLVLLDTRVVGCTLEELELVTGAKVGKSPVSVGSVFTAELPTVSSPVKTTVVGRAIVELANSVVTSTKVMEVVVKWILWLPCKVVGSTTECELEDPLGTSVVRDED